MGDAGALFLGVIVAVLTIRLDPQIKPQVKSFAIPLLLMAVPILDTTVAVTSRIYRGISPFQGGRDHLSHRLMRRGLDRRIAAIALWALAALYGALALALYRSPENLGYPVIAAGGIVWAGLLAFFLRTPSTD
jgi:UDP-GlcNAc:undecaprenyl-phosphate GlcNAc-1-phosphate transferase